MAAAGVPALGRALERASAARRAEVEARLALRTAEERVGGIAARAQQLADAIGSALSLDAWVVLRRRDGLSVERAKAVWNLTLTALLAHELGTGKAA